MLAALALIGLCLGSVVVYNLTYTQYQGRFLFPVLSLITALTTLGIGRFVGRVPSARARLALTGGIVTVLVAIDVVSLFVLHDFFYTADQYA